MTLKIFPSIPVNNVFDRNALKIFGCVRLEHPHTIGIAGDINLPNHETVAIRVEHSTAYTLFFKPRRLDHLSRLPLALQVFKEALRLYPPAYIVVREALEDIDVGGTRVRKGQLLAMCERLLHRNPKYFPDPLRFDPIASPRKTKHASRSTRTFRCEACRSSRGEPARLEVRADVDAATSWVRAASSRTDITPHAV